MSETNLQQAWRKFQTMLFVNMGTTAVPDWARIGKSTIFDVAFNAQTATYDFIEDENPTDVIKNYKPSLAQELHTIEGDKAFDYMFTRAYNLPTGTDANGEYLVVFPKKTTDGKFIAWLSPATEVFKNFNVVDGKIQWDINFSGNMVRGTVVITAGKPVFSIAATVPEGEAS